MHDGAPLSRAALLLAISTTVAITPSVARADGPSWIGGQAAFFGGASLATSQALLNRDLRRVGWQEVPMGRAEWGGQFGLSLFDVTLDVHFIGNGVARKGPRGEWDALTLDRGMIGLDVGYRARLAPLFTLHPFVGIGTMSSTLCLAGHPDATSHTSRPPFEQVLRNPGRTMCLETSDIAMDIGIFPALDIPVFARRTTHDALGAHLAIGPRFTFSTPVTQTRTWTETTSVETLPAFQGPLAPVGGFFVGLEAEFHAELE